MPDLKMSINGQPGVASDLCLGTGATLISFFPLLGPVPALEKDELERLILCDLQNDIYPELERIFLKSIKDAGFPDMKLEKKIDFEKLYQQKLN